MVANPGKLDMTQGTEWKHIFLFSLPIMAGNLLQQLYNTVDGIVVGNFVSQEALAATGTAGTLAFLFLAISMGFGNAAGIMVAQFFGARQYKELRSSVSTALILLLSAGLVLSVFGSLCARMLLRDLMNINDEAVLKEAVSYFSIYATGIVLQFLYNAVAYILRAVGDSKATLYFLLVSSVLNIGLDLLFVVCFHWGVAGAAVATVISQFGSALVSVVYMFRKYEIFRFRKGEFRFERDKGLLCVRLGIPSVLQTGIVSFGNIFCQRLINSFGAVTMAAFTVGVRIENYMFVPINGYQLGLSNFTAQNVGARRFDRVKRGSITTCAMSVITTILLGLVLYVFARPVSGFFGITDETLSLSVQYVRFLALTFWIFGIYIPLLGTLQGAGDVVYSSFCSLVALGVRVGLAYFFVYLFDFGCTIIFKCMPIGWGAAFVFTLIRFLSGTWQKKGVVRYE